MSLQALRARNDASRTLSHIGLNMQNSVDLLKTWLKKWLNRWAARYVQARWEQRRRHWAGVAEQSIRLHIGCGDIDAPGFINVDARPRPHVHIVTSDLFRLMMIPSGVADMIYMCHVLEHVSHRQLDATLREMHRVLRKGGVLRISVPDFDCVVNAYSATGNDIGAIEKALMGGQDYEFNFHYSAFNARRLIDLLLKSGFDSTRPWDPFNCENHDFEDWASKKIPFGELSFPISLNIEGIK